MSPKEQICAIELFEYPDSGKSRPSLWDELPEIGSESPASPSPEHAENSGTVQPESKDDPAAAVISDLESNFQKAREQGIREGREQAQAAQQMRMHEIEKKRIAESAQLVHRLAQERERFFERAEQDVVQLSLAIAERTLRREAQTDPLFLVGAVRVALGQLAQSTRVRVRVPGEEAELWTQTMAHIPNLKVKPEVVGDQGMQSGDCIIESEMGSADLSLSAQLDCIQHALLDEKPRGADQQRPVSTVEAGEPEV